MNIVEVNEENFEKEVLNYKGKVVVDFNAPWCGVCKMMAPIFEELSEEIKDVKFVSVDTDEAEGLAIEYGIFSIPTFLVFENGKEKDRHSGFLSKDDFTSFLGR